MKKYDEYKDSGIEWIGGIPKHWNVRKVKSIFSFRTGFTPPSGKEEYYQDGNHVWINISDLQNKIVSDSANKITNKAIEDFKPTIVPKNSLLYSFKLSVGKVAFNAKDCYTNEAIFSIDPNDSTNLNFFYYSLPRQIIKNANENIYGAKILNQELIKNAVLIIPSPVEQTAIANYLDRKTAEIDELIADKKRLLELYEEEKTAIINQAVTKGINPAAPMKDSGIEWLGVIPKYWEVKKLKWVHRTTSGGTPKTSNSENYNGEIPWLRTLDLNNDEVFGCEIKITEKALSESSAKIVPTNSVLVAMYGGAGTIGKSGLLRFKASINQAICAILPNEKVMPKFLHYYIMFLRPYWMIGAEGTRRDPNISQDDIKNKEFLFPPFEEQQSIVLHIETNCSKIAAKIEKTEKLVRLLTEYRTTLISEAVTGKIKVTN